MPIRAALCRRKCLSILILVGFVTWAAVILNLNHHFRHYKKTVIERQLDTGKASRGNASTTKTILFWTSWFGGVDVESDLNIKFDTCPVNCRIALKRNMIEKSDAVIFHVLSQDELRELPTYRRPDQRFIFFTFESPMGPVTNRKVYKSLPRNYFNWTATYRLDSDLFGKYFYGWKFEPKKNPGTHSTHSDQPTMDNYGIDIISKTKTKLNAWFVSNCNTPVNREAYVAELKKHIAVDVFGKCPLIPDTQSCPRANSQCDDMLRKNYLFYLSFENSFCPDYVTEKFYRPFRLGAVPVVLGGANYSLFAPPHSYINARDFETPKQLADYLLKLSKDRDLYARYFDWKKYYDLEPLAIQLKEQWCKLCQMLNDPSLPAKSYPDIEKWWFEDRPCENYHWSNTNV